MLKFHSFLNHSLASVFKMEKTCMTKLSNTLCSHLEQRLLETQRLYDKTLKYSLLSFRAKIVGKSKYKIKIQNQNIIKQSQCLHIQKQNNKTRLAIGIDHMLKPLTSISNFTTKRYHST